MKRACVVNNNENCLGTQMVSTVQGIDVEIDGKRVTEGIASVLVI